MNLSQEVLMSILRRGLTPEEEANLIIEYSERRVKVEERYRKIEKLKNDTDSKIAKLLAEVICKHELRKNHGDPSGGSDSTEECLICGEFLHEKSVRFT